MNPLVRQVEDVTATRVTGDLKMRTLMQNLFAGTLPTPLNLPDSDVEASLSAILQLFYTTNSTSTPLPSGVDVPMAASTPRQGTLFIAQPDGHLAGVGLSDVVGSGRPLFVATDGAAGSCVRYYESAGPNSRARGAAVPQLVVCGYNATARCVPPF